MADATGTTEKLKDAVPTDALRDAGQQLLALLVQRAAEAATERVSGLSDRLSGVAESGGQGLREALSPNGDRRDDDEDGGSGPGLLSRGWSALKGKVQGMFGGGGGGGGGGGKKLKVTVIVENQDIGLPLRTTYDLWTQFADFPSFMKKVEDRRAGQSTRRPTGRRRSSGRTAPGRRRSSSRCPTRTSCGGRRGRRGTSTGR